MQREHLTVSAAPGGRPRAGGAAARTQGRWPRRRGAAAPRSVSHTVIAFPEGKMGQTWCSRHIRERINHRMVFRRLGAFQGYEPPESNTLSVKKRNRNAESTQSERPQRFSAPRGHHGGGRPRPAGQQLGPHRKKAWAGQENTALSSKGRALKDPLGLISLCMRFLRLEHQVLI